MNNNFFEIIRKYCLVEEIDFVFKNKSKEMCDVLQNFNDYINNNFFDYKITTDNSYDYANLPKTFIVEWTESYFLILQKEKNKLINLTSTDIVTQDELLSKRVFYLSKELKNINDVDVFDAIKKMTPGASYFSLGLVFFALMTPLYSNLFNTRLIYSDSYHSVFFVTGIFIIFVIFELI
ncbi:type I secretion protein, partial [Salmonella enterica subsp. arizonae serovar 18:z4,z23:-]|nr:type I secretion protein [Salmonella enterica subsp. arizonae serovar 18:z4,z23:-]